MNKYKTYIMGGFTQLIGFTQTLMKFTRPPQAIIMRNAANLLFLSAGLFSVSVSANQPAGGGYVDGNTVLTPAKSINTGGISIAPTFNNDQFNDKALVGTVHNDPVRTPSTADPVSTVSGNNYHDETDLVIRGRSGLNMVFTRTYNSAPNSTKVDKGVGYGWTHSYLMQLKSNDFGDCPNCTAGSNLSAGQRPENGNNKTASVTYTDERGGEQNYLVNESSFTVTSPKGVYDTLSLDTPVAGQHTINFRNGVKYIFETPTGNLKLTPNITSRLKYIDDAWGNRLTLVYDGSGRLSNISDNLAIPGRTGLGFTYDTNGRLKEVSDWTARKYSYQYDSAGNLFTVTNPLSQSTSYYYDSAKHLLTTIRKPLQRNGVNVETRFKYYENGRTFQQTNSFGDGDTLDYDLYRKSTRVTDARGGVRQYFYDENGRMTKLTEPDGAVLLFENQNDAIRSKKYDALGYATTYSYRADKEFTGVSDSFGNVTREQDALGGTVDTTYTTFDQIASIKDKRGNTSTTTYASASLGCDYANRPRETRLSLLNGVSNALLASFCWNSNATLNYSRIYLDAAKYVERRLSYEPASNGLNVSQEQLIGTPSGLTINKTYTYDTLGRKKTETLQRRASPNSAGMVSLTTRYDYDALDRVIKTTDSLGNEAINLYDANGQLWKVTHRYKTASGFDVRDVSTRYFDAAERVIMEVDAEGNSTSHSYDESGNLIASTDAEGHTTRYEYDEMNRRTAVIDATGYRTDTTYNQRGDIVAVTNANGETIRFEIDALGRKTAAIDPKGFRTEFQYDANNNLICTIDANALAGLHPKNTLGCSISQQYDELGRVIKTTDALNGETRYSYDFTGNRLSITDPENKPYSFAYDELGRLISETDHSGKVSTYLVDEAGNPYQKTNRLGEVSKYTYDTANRLTRIDYLKDNSAETYSYDAAGNKASSANNLVGYSFIYDRLNRLTKKLDSRNGQLIFTYDKVGNLLTKTTYQNTTTHYQYNAANRLVSLSNLDYLQADYQLDPAGRVLSRVSNSGARSLMQYDANGWLSKLSQYDSANALVNEAIYTRDRVGNILTQTNTAGANPGSITYTYDALYRLTTADYPNASNDEAYTYDKVGNRKTATKGSLSANATTRYYNYTPNTNRLAEIRIGSATGALESTFTYNFEGELTSQTGSGAKTFVWDAKGRLKTLTKSGVTETYGYDPMDYRIRHSNTANGQLDYFLEGEHLESVEQGGQTLEKYFRGASTDELIAAYLKDTDGKTKPYQYHHDHLTSTTQVTAHNGGTLQATTYSAFGAIQSQTGSSPNRLKYTGREDDGTGLYYYRARYYDPSTGRFISEDPLGFEAGINFYAYVDNNPINANDPTGMCPICLPLLEIANLARNAFTVVNAARTATAVSQAAAVGAGSSVAVGGAIRGATGGTVFDKNAITFDAVIGGTLGVAGHGVNALRVAGSSSVFKGEFASNLASQQLGKSVIGTEVSVMAGGARPRIDFLTQQGSSLIGVEAKYGMTPLTTPQRIGYGAINSGGTSSLFGKNAANSFFQGTSDSILGSSVSGVNTLRFGALDANPSVYSFFGGGLGGASANGGFLLYPNKTNNNQMQSVYNK
jgi:RHS repeat-associated protein